ncbi:MAG: FMN-binding protein [Acidobacteriota bacterium]
MARHPTPQGSNWVRALQKFAVSGFVICSFMAYAVHEHFTTSNRALDSVAPSPTEPVAQVVPDVPTTGSAARPTVTRPPARQAPAPTSVPKTANGQYKDGTFTGPSVNAMWGLVRVQAVVQGGQLKNVQVLDYPSDRRTSQRINQQVLPWLQTEVIQAQSANVDIISGATLTSQAYMRSLQVALNNAKN